jgi:hypothetical protein
MRYFCRGVRKHVAEIDRLVVDRHVLRLGEIDERLVAEEGPGRDEREVIVDGTGHGMDSMLAGRGA